MRAPISRCLTTVAIAVCVSALGLAVACSGGGDSASSGDAQEAGDRIKIAANNSRYFEWSGEIVYLLGATESGADSCGDQNGWMPISSGFDWQPDLERLLDNGGNYARVIPYFSGHPVMPWVEVEDGQFDLEQINPDWVARLRAYLEWTLANRIVVQLEIFENFSFKDATWLANPLHPDKNINYGTDAIAAESRREDIAIYRAVTEENESVLRLLRNYVSTLVLETAPYGNVIYSISNESNASLEWAEYWANYVNRLGSSRGYDLLVGEMPHAAEPTTGVEAIVDSEEFDFVDASSYTSEDQYGEDDVVAILAGTDEVIPQLATFGKPVTVGKIYYRSTATLWSKFINGSASARFHRNCNRGGTDEDNPERYFDYVRYLRSFIDELDLTNAKVTDDDLVSGALDGVQVDVLAAPGEWYAAHLYKTDVGAEPSDLAIELPEGEFSARWFDPGSGTWTPADMTEPTDDSRSLTIPDFETSIALLVERLEP